MKQRGKLELTLGEYGSDKKYLISDKLGTGANKAIKGPNNGPNKGARLNLFIGR